MTYSGILSIIVNGDLGFLLWTDAIELDDIWNLKYLFMDLLFLSHLDYLLSLFFPLLGQGDSFALRWLDFGFFIAG